MKAHVNHENLQAISEVDEILNRKFIASAVFHFILPASYAQSSMGWVKDMSEKALTTANSEWKVLNCVFMLVLRLLFFKSKECKEIYQEELPIKVEEC